MVFLLIRPYGVLFIVESLFLNYRLFLGYTLSIHRSCKLNLELGVEVISSLFLPLYGYQFSWFVFGVLSSKVSWLEVLLVPFIIVVIVVVVIAVVVVVVVIIIIIIDL